MTACERCGSRDAGARRRGYCDPCHVELAATAERVLFAGFGIPGDRFLAKVNVHGDLPEHDPGMGPCWVWTGALSRGYGMFRLGPGELVAAHVWAHKMAFGDLPEGWAVDHQCHDPSVCAGGEDDPHRACVNPSHLRGMPRAENKARGSGPAARNARKTHCDAGHPLSGANLYVHPTRGHRHCRTCQQIRVRAWERRVAQSRAEPQPERAAAS